MGESEAERIKSSRFVKGERVFVRLVSNGQKLRLSFGEKDGGCFLIGIDFVRELIAGRVLESYGVWCPDDPKYIAKRDGR